MASHQLPWRCMSLARVSVHFGADIAQSYAMTLPAIRVSAPKLCAAAWSCFNRCKCDFGFRECRPLILTRPLAVYGLLRSTNRRIIIRQHPSSCSCSSIKTGALAHQKCDDFSVLQWALPAVEAIYQYTKHLLGPGGIKLSKLLVTKIKIARKTIAPVHRDLKSGTHDSSRKPLAHGLLNTALSGLLQPSRQSGELALPAKKHG